MIVQLVRVVFDHATGSARTRALHIRQDGATAAGSDVAAYALVPAKGRQLTVEAELQFPGQGLSGLAPGTTIRVRARAAQNSATVLGHVRARDVVVPAAGQTTTLLFTLSAPTLQKDGVGVYRVVWDWQFQLTAAGPWIPFHTTTSTIFVTLDQPTHPWTQALDAASTRRWPWVRMLKVACAWAEGVTLAPGRPAAAKRLARRIEHAVYALGTAGRFRYDNTQSRYIQGASAGIFRATAFLDDFQGSEEDLGIYCTECAAVVATAANCLGGDLTLLRLDRPSASLHLNSHVLIGRTHANEGGFSYHDLAIRQHGSTRQVFDATLRPDWDVDTRDSEHDYRLAQGRRLGTPELKPKGTAYLQRLLEARVEAQWDDLLLCDVVMPCLDQCDGVAPPADPCTDRLFEAHYQQISATVPVAPRVFPEPRRILDVPIPGYRAYRREANPSRFLALAPLVSAAVEFRYVSVPDGRPKARRGARRARPQQFRMAVAWSPTPEDAQRALAWLMVRTDVPLSRVAAPNGSRIGDAALGSGRGQAVYVVRGNVLAQITSPHAVRAPMTAIAWRLDRAIVSRWSSREAAKDSAGKSTSPAQEP